ncbi:MAG: hypothetical protein ACK4GO_12310 [Gemmobacter sp.]
MIATRRIVLALTLIALAACARKDLATEPLAPLGNFRLGLNIVVTDKMQKVPISRNATGEEWEAALKKAMQDRFGRYKGDKFYNIGLVVDGYALAPPGIPLVASPKSILVVTVAVFDDAAGVMLNKDGKGEQLSVFEETSGKSLIGSGLTRTAEEQMESLAFNTAKRVEQFLRENPEWFGLPRGRRDTSAETE